MRVIFLFFSLLFNTFAIGQPYPPKKAFDAEMIDIVKQTNAQMAGIRIDEYMNLKFVNYDPSVPSFNYFYTSSVLKFLNQKELNTAQVKAMMEFNIKKSCATEFVNAMKPYGLEITHIIEDKFTGLIFYRYSVTKNDCFK
jgi:hypothetical protein